MNVYNALRKKERDIFLVLMSVFTLQDKHCRGEIKIIYTFILLHKLLCRYVARVHNSYFMKARKLFFSTCTISLCSSVELP